MNVLPVLSLLAMVGAAAEPQDVAALPPDGAWVRYDVTYTYESDQKATAKVTIRFVGTVEIDGKPCRWIEQESFEKGDLVNDYSAHFISKLLIAESDLRESDKPLSCAKRCLSRRNDEPLQRPKPGSFQIGGQDFAFLPGVLRKTKEHPESKTIDYQRGRLENAKGRTGRYEYSLFFDNGIKPIQNEVKYTIWIHPEMPLGFASATMQRTAKMNAAPSARIDYFLKDFGNGAKPAIAEVE